ncbi:MAG: uroporphyrinogen decarboxylase family protein [Armatimonadota bacterium]
MTARERVLAAICHRQADLVPWNLMWVPTIGAQLARHFGTEDLDAAVGNHIFFVGARSRKPLYAEPEKYGSTITDDFGVVWQTSARDRGHVLVYPLREPDCAAIQWPDPHEPWRWEGVAEALAAGRADMFVAAVAGDLWERATFMRPLAELLVDLHEHPRFVHELLDRICEFDLAVLGRLVDLPVDGVFVSDDYGSQRQLIMSPAHWRQFVAPRLGRLLEFARARGLVTMLHSCGNVREIIPDLIDLGLDVLHPIQPEAMDVYALKREFGRDLTLWGGISTQHTLPYATPAEVRAEVREKRERLGAGGGYILEPGITIQADVPLANVLVLIEAAREPL